MDERDGLEARNHDLEERLAEAEDTLRALRNGEVDAVVAVGPDGHRVYTLRGADEPYRLLVQEMAEGAMTLTTDGLILFANQQFADTLGSPLERVIGARVFDFLDPDYLSAARALIDQASRGNAKGEVRFRRSDGRSFPAYVSVSRLHVEGLSGFCMVVTDLTEQKRTEEVVVAERLARSILEQAAEAILVIDLHGRIIRASRAADRLAGLSVVLRDVDEVFQIRSPGGVQFTFDVILAMARRGVGIEPMEMTAHTVNGETLYVLFSLAPLSGSTEGLLGCIIHLTDITQRKRIEKTLRDSEEMYRSLANAMPQIVYVTRPDGAYEFVNRQWAEFTGESNSTGSDLPWSTRIHPDDQPRALEQWSNSVNTGEPFETEYRLLGQDGRYHWHLSRATPVWDVEGTITKWIGTSTDIDTFKQTESKLRESEARLRTMAEALPEILFTTLPDGYCDYVSARAYEFSGAPAGTISGLGWQQIIHEDDRLGVQQHWERSRSTALAFCIEFRMRRADSVYRWMQVRAEPMLGPNREVVKWFGVCSDIDDHKQLEQSLQQRSIELARSNEELQRFAYAASHDLQEPLRTIGGMSRILSKKLAGKLDTDGLELFEHIESGVVRMSNMIRDLLAYSRVSIESSPSARPVDCESLLSFALMNVQAQITQTHATVTHDPLPMVMADEQLLRVFQNLIGNALKYRSTANPAIHVSAAWKGGEWVISVRDNGIGLDMRYANRIFDVFQRLHSRTEYEGTGIGLAISRRVIERFGGRIWVESEPGTGSTFFFSLKAADSMAVVGRQG